MHIGILDDNQTILDYVKTMLELSGHTVATHTNSRSLFDVLFRSGSIATPLPYDLVILDLCLPGDLSGIEVYRTIRSNITGDSLPVLFCTAASDRTIQGLQDCLPEAIPLLRKPFRSGELLSKLDELCRDPHPAHAF